MLWVLLASCGWSFQHYHHDIHLKDENGEIDWDTQVEDYELIGNIMCDVGDSDYIYEKIQDYVDEATEEQLMLYQQELVETK